MNAMYLGFFLLGFLTFGSSYEITLQGLVKLRKQMTSGYHQCLTAVKSNSSLILFAHYGTVFVLLRSSFSIRATLLGHCLSPGFQSSGRRKENM